jgi:T1SS-143 domain-containing protein
MNERIRIAEVGNTPLQNSAPLKVVTVVKPGSEQAITIDLGFDQKTKIDFSSVTNEKMTLVHVGTKLIVLFDNHSTVTIAPFFDSSGHPLANLDIGLGAGHDVNGDQFASLFPITDDQSVLPAAGGGGSPASGADFHTPTVDPLAGGTPLPLLGQEELGNFTTTNFLAPQVQDIKPSVSGSFATATVLEADLDETKGGDDLSKGFTTGTDPDGTHETTIVTGVTFSAGSQAIDLTFDTSVVTVKDGGTTVHLFWVASNGGTEITGYLVDPVQNPQAPPAIIIELTSTHADANGSVSPSVTVTLTDAFPHDPANHTGSDTISIDGLNVVATDTSGDTATAPLTIHILDDAPTIDVTTLPHEGNALALTLDESIGGDTGGNGNGANDDVGSNTHPDPTGTNPIGEVKTATSALENLFSIAKDAGADGQQSLTYTYSLTLGGTGSNDGAFATTMKVTDATGHYPDDTIYLFKVSDTEIVGRVGDNPNGDIALRITLTNPTDIANGQMVVDQYMAIDHGNDGNNFDSAQLLKLAGADASLGVTLQAVIVDGDNDSATSSSTVVIADHNSSSVSIEDDGPTVTITPHEFAGNNLFFDGFIENNNAWGTGSGINLSGVAGGWAISTSGTNNDGSGAVQLERVGDGYEGMHSSTGGFMVDLDASPRDLALTQTITNLTNGQTYTLSFEAGAPFPNSAHLEVLFGGQVVAEIDPTNAMQTYTFNIVGGSGDHSNQLEFRETGTPDNQGTYLANVNISGAAVIVDESAGINPGSNDTIDPTVIAQFVGVQNVGHDPNMVTQYATGTFAAVDVNVNFGTDGPAGGSAAAGTKYTLSVAATPGGVDSGLATTDGREIYLFNENGIIVGRYDAPHDGNTTVDGTDPAAFAITINQTTGVISVAQYVSLDNPDATNPNDAVTLDKGVLTAVVTVTDGDGDHASATADISNEVSFHDDGPTVTVSVDRHFAVTIDETPGVQNDDVPFTLHVFDHVANPGNDPDEPGPVLAYAQSDSSALNVNAVFGADGPKDESTFKATAFSLSVADHTDSGLKTTDGREIYLFNENGIVVGRYDAPHDGNTTVDHSDPAAFAIAIDPQTGVVSIVQYVSLNNPDTHNSDDQVTLNGNTISAVVTVTDGDGDQKSASADISGDIHFQDDGPSITGFAIKNTVDEDDIATPYATGTSPNDGNGDGSYTGSSSDNLPGPANVTGTLAGHVDFGADGPGANAYSFTSSAIATMTALSLSSHGHDLSYVINGNVLTGYVDTSHDHQLDGNEHAVFTLTVNSTTGGYTFNLYDALDHVSGNGQNTTLEAGNHDLSQIDFGSILQATDGDGDSVTLTGQLLVKIVDDVPTVSVKATGEANVVLTTQDADAAGNAHDTATSTANFGGVFSVTSAYGADGPGSTVSQFDLTITGQSHQGRVDSNLESHGKDIYLYENNQGVIVGSTAQSAGQIGTSNTIFTISVDGNGVVTLTQYGPIDHSGPGATQGPYDTQTVSLGNNLVSLKETVTITDDDGDKSTSSASIDLGNNVSFADDGPKVIGQAIAQTVDEDDISTQYAHGTSPNDGNADGSYTASPSDNGPGPADVTGTLSGHVNFGGDGPNGNAYAFTGNAAATMTALGLTSHGFALTYSVSGETLTASIDTNGNAPGGKHTVFTLTVDNDSGNYTFNLYDSLDHTGIGQDTSLHSSGNINSIDFGSVLKATDYDGDSVSLSGQLVITVRDDVPVPVNATVYAGEVYEDGLPGGNLEGPVGSQPTHITITAAELNSLVLPGADGLAGFSFNAAKDGTLAGVNSDGSPVHYTISGDTLSGVTADGRTVFTLVDQHDGTFDFTLTGNLDHSGGGDSQTLTLNLGSLFTATDGDGDSVVLSGSLNVKIENDVPVITAQTNLIINGSFEQDDGGLTNGQWSIFHHIPGWDSVNQQGIGDVPFEIQVGNPGGLAAEDGNALVELDSDTASGNLPNTDPNHQNTTGHTNSIIQQVVAGTEAGQTYELTFYYSPRPGEGDANSGSLNVLWNGEIVKTIDSSGLQPGWQQIEVFVEGTGPNNTLGFQATGQENSLGALIDNVSLVPMGVVDEDGLSVANGDKVTGNHDSQTGDINVPNNDHAPAAGGDNNEATSTGLLDIKWGADSYDGGTDTYTDAAGFKQDASGRSVTFTTNVVGVTGNAGNALTSHGDLVTFSLMNNGTELVGQATDSSGNTRVVIDVTLSDDGSGAYHVVLKDALDHAPGNDENDIILSFNFKATDSDGDSAPGTFHVLVDDDVPVLTGNIASGSVNESNIGGTTPIVQALSLDFQHDQINHAPDLTGTHLSITGGAGIAVVSFDASVFVLQGPNAPPSGGATPMFITADAGTTFTLNSVLLGTFGTGANTLTLKAYDANGTLIGTATFNPTTLAYVSQEPTAAFTAFNNLSISKLEIDPPTSNFNGRIVLDNLSVTTTTTPVPHPAETVVDLTPLVSVGADSPGTWSLTQFTNQATVFTQGSSVGAPTYNGVPITMSSDGHVITGSAGGVEIFTLTLSSDGHATFDLFKPIDGGTLRTIDFSQFVTVTDDDGDSVKLATGDLVININSQDHLPSVTPDSASVSEKGIPAHDGQPAGSSAGDNSNIHSGSIAITLGDGPSTVTINNVVVSAGEDIAGAYGTLHINSINATSISYTYTLTTANHDGDTSSDVFNVKVTDDDNQSATTPLTIHIVDDVPTARADSDSVSSQQHTLTFDDIPLSDGQEQPLPAGYDTFNITQGGVYNPGGGTYATHSGENLAFIGEKNGINQEGYTGNPGDPITIRHVDGTNFTAVGAWFSSNSTDPLQITITAYDDNNNVIGTEVASIHTGPNGGPTYVDMSGLGSADHLTIQSPAGAYFGFDDFTYVDNAAATGNVITGASTNDPVHGADTVGADGANVYSIVSTFVGGPATVLDPTNGASVAGHYGTLTINEDGSYSYVRFDGAPLTGSDQFTYTLIDGDGDKSPATLTINISDSAVTETLPTSGSAGTVVDEQGLVPAGSHAGDHSQITNGTISYSAPDGVSVILIDGVPATVGLTYASTTGFGSLTITSLTPGAIGYTYTLGENTSGDHTSDHFAIEVVDSDGDSATQNLTIAIVDDVPTAHADTNSVNENVTLHSDATTNVLHNDVSGADGFTANAVVGVQFSSDTSHAVSGNVGSVVQGLYGDLTLNADGSYTYAAHSVGANESDTFVYTVTDSDGSLSTTTLTIDVNNVNQPLAISGAITGTVYEDALPNANIDPGTTPTASVSGNLAADLSYTGDEGGLPGLSFSFTALGSGQQQVHTTDSAHPLLTSDGHAVYFHQVDATTLIGYTDDNNSHAYNNGDTTVFTLTLNQSTGAYTFTLNAPIDQPVNSTEDTLSIDLGGRVQVTDTTGNNDTQPIQNFSIGVVDDIPIATPHTASVNEGGGATNLVLMIDTSGSVDGSTLAHEKTAAINLLNAGINGGKVLVVDFDSNAHASGWLSVSDAITYINGLSSGGDTNYDAALQTTMNYINTHTTPAAAQTVAYFLSDGQPTNGDGIGSSDQTTWDNFLNTQHITVYGVNFSSLNGDSDIAPIAYPSDSSHNVGIGTQGTTLPSYPATTSHEVTGNVLTGDSFGADGKGAGAGLLSIVVGNTTYTFNGTSITYSDNGGIHTIAGSTLDVQTAIGGELKFYFATGGGHNAGDYVYDAPTSVSANQTENFTYTIVDGDGDRSSAGLAITVKNVLQAPNGLDLASQDDSSSSLNTAGTNSDNITNHTTNLTVTGNAENGTKVVLFDDTNNNGVQDNGETTLGTSATVTNGTFSVDVSLGSDGTHHVVAVETAAGSDPSAGSTPLDIVIDTTAPVAAITGIVNDTGVVGDHITSDNKLLIQGTAEAGSSVEVYRGSTDLGHVTADSNGNWTFDNTNDQLSNGQTYTYTAKATDVAGNTGATSAGYGVTIDRTDPEVTVKISASSLNVADNSSLVTFTFTEAPVGFTAADIQASHGSISNFSGSGTTYTATFTADSGYDGTGSVSVPNNSFTDAAGNGGDGNSDSVSIDTVPPTNTVAITEIINDTGSNTHDFITSDSKLTVEGTYSGSLNGGSIQISTDGGATWHNTTAGGGDWSYNDATRPDGTFTYTVRVVDDSGNVGNSASQAVTIDTQKPGLPSAPDLTDASDSGTSHTDNITNDKTPTFTGTAEVGSTVTIYANGNAVGSAVTDGTGHYNVTTSTLGDNTYNITATATDAAGNASNASGTLSVKIDTNADVSPAAKVQFNDGDGFINATESGSANFTLSGIDTDATATVTFTSSNGGSPVVVSGLGNGAQSVDLAGLHDGTITASISLTDIAGNTAAGGGGSSDSSTKDTIAPSGTPTITAVTDNVGPTVNVSNGGLTNDNTLQISGTATNGATVDIFDGGNKIGQVTANNGNGSWSFTTSTLPDGAHSFTAAYEDTAGNVGTDSGARSVVVDATAPALTITSDQSGTINSADGSVTYTFQFSENVTGFVSTDISVTNGSKGTFTAVDGDTYKLVVTPDAGEQGNLTVSVGSGAATDAAGNDNTSASNVQAYDTKAPTVSSETITSAVGIQSSYVNAGDVVRVSVGMSEAVTVSGTPRLALNIGGNTVQATYDSSQSTATSLVFTYTIIAGQNDSNGISIGSNALSLNGGSITDTAGNTASLNFGTVADNANYKVDTTAPTLTITTADDSANTVSGAVSDSGSGVSSVTVKDGSTTIGTDNSVGSGTWSITSTAFHSGETITASATDAAGNTANATRTAVAPAGTSGEAINLALAGIAPNAHGAVSLNVAGVPAGWVLSEGVRNADGSWSITTNDVSSVSVTSPNGYTGALILHVTESWTNADGSTGTAYVADNVEAYSKGSPIFAWSGDDTLTASSGNDTLVFANAIGIDVVHNFDVLHDKIDLIGFAGFSSFADVQAHLTSDAGGNAVITLADGQTITLAGIDAASLTAADFVFNETPVTHNAGDMVLSDGSLLPLSGTVDNSGTIHLNSSGSETNLEIVQHGATLQGGGTLVLSDSAENVIFGSDASVTLTNVDNTISGAGQLGEGHLTLINDGMIIATGDNALVIDTGANTVDNSGTLEALGAGGLLVHSDILNDGLLWANGSELTLDGNVSGSGSALISGNGTLEIGGAFNEQVLFDSTAAGTLVLDHGADFKGVIVGFDHNDTLDLEGIFGNKATVSYAENSQGTGGTLTVTDGTNTANIAMAGQYSTSDFHVDSSVTNQVLIHMEHQAQALAATA